MYRGELGAEAAESKSKAQNRFNREITKNSSGIERKLTDKAEKAIQAEVVTS